MIFICTHGPWSPVQICTDKRNDIFRCLARVRTKEDGEVEVVETKHNHGILMERRKKGTLKAMYDEKRRQRKAEQAEHDDQV